MDYEYKNQHLSVEIAEALLAKTSTSGQKIRTIRRHLLKHHQDKGGLEPLGGGTGSLIMIRALGNLQKRAKTTAMGDNIWRIAKRDQWIFAIISSRIKRMQNPKVRLFGDARSDPLAVLPRQAI